MGHPVVAVPYIVKDCAATTAPCGHMTLKTRPHRHGGSAEVIVRAVEEVEFKGATAARITLSFVSRLDWQRGFLRLVTRVPTRY
jgi:hypothetical protein